MLPTPPCGRWSQPRSRSASPRSGSARLSCGRVDIQIGPIYAPLESLEYIAIPVVMTRCQDSDGFGHRPRGAAGRHSEPSCASGGNRGPGSAPTGSDRRARSLGYAVLPQAVPAFSTVSSVPAFRLSVLRNARHLLDDINAIWDGDLPFRIAASAPSALPRQRSIYRSAVWRGTGHHDWPTPNGLTVMRVVRD